MSAATLLHNAQHPAEQPGEPPRIAAVQHAIAVLGAFSAAEPLLGVNEIARQLAEVGEAADWIVVPTGGGGTAAGIWRAYGEMRALGLVARSAREAHGAPDIRETQDARKVPGGLPRIATVQPSSYNALEIALRDGLSDDAALYALGISEETPTVQGKLQHGVPPDALYALAALRESGGAAVSVTDREALSAQRRLAREGIFGEPSAAAALAGVLKLIERGVIGPHDRVVALVTGSGYRELAATAAATAQLAAQATATETAHATATSESAEGADGVRRVPLTDHALALALGA